MSRLRRSDCSGPGITRRRRGKGFEYLDDEGNRIEEPEVLDRIRELGIPPAWENVWVCPYPFGHLQATGIDAAGRKQYLYHPRWRARRDAEKFDDMIRFARCLPELRRRVDKDLRREELDRRRVLACAVRLLDRGFFRIGSEEYKESFGLATMQKSHVTLAGDGEMLFDYPAKSAQRRIQGILDPLAYEVVTALKRRRGGGDELLAYKDGRRWRDLRSEEINEYIKDATSEDFSAKDFRTWNATVLAAVALSVSGEVAASKTGRKRAVTRAIKEVAHYLGNTPAVCRASYIDPRVFDAYRGGLVIKAPTGQPIHHRGIEEAVLDLLNARERSPAIEKVAA
ncbi:MAG TPA: DNA topoisomerase IB [Solirubrobacteraceae bacterium]|nr:DNA topoisomerase IB [Solirubrobacteraceae bacterium]